ncbi:MAG TPA: hypothetical protein VE620_08310 [Myxococcales bacterium]|jgi:hypothetical protein|nr:hypothetical protein [Myxococcales bacterium]
MRASLIAIVLASACVTAEKPRKERALLPDIVVANSMCTAPGTETATKDPVGDRMICKFEKPTGSHMLECVCHDEKRSYETDALAMPHSPRMCNREHNGSGTSAGADGCSQ